MAPFVERHPGGTGVPAPLPAPTVGRLGILRPGAPRIGGLLISVEPEGQPAGAGGSAVAHRPGARAGVGRGPSATRQGRKRTAEAVDGRGAEAGAEGSTPSDALCLAGGGAQATGAVPTSAAGARAPARAGRHRGLLGPGAGGFAPSHRSTARGGSSRGSSATRQGRKRTAEAVAGGGDGAGAAGSASSGALCLAGGAAQVTGADSTSAAARGAGAPGRAGRRRLTGSPPSPEDGGVAATSGGSPPTAHIVCNKGRTSLGPSGNAFASKAGGRGIEPTVCLSLSGSPSRSSRVDAGAILVGVSISQSY